MTLADQILDVADALTEPTLNREPIPYWDHNRHRKIKHHTTVLPGLLAQLHQSVHPVWSTAEDPAGAIPASRPPLEIEALSRHQQITDAARGWTLLLGLEVRATVESNIRALVGATARLDDTQQRDLLADLRRWRSWCRVYLGHEHVQHIRAVPCPLPECQQRGTLRINLTTETGLCTACGAIWNRDTIGLLAEHIKTSRRPAASRS